MNRRDFAKALAGIPLLGLLAKVPEAKDPYHEIDIFNGASHQVDLTWDKGLSRLLSPTKKAAEAMAELGVSFLDIQMNCQCLNICLDCEEADIGLV